MLDTPLKIFVKPVGCEAFVAFHWTRDAASGIERARREAAERGIVVEDAWVSLCAGKERA